MPSKLLPMLWLARQISSTSKPSCLNLRPRLIRRRIGARSSLGLRRCCCCSVFAASCLSLSTTRCCIRATGKRISPRCSSVLMVEARLLTRRRSTFANRVRLTNRLHQRVMRTCLFWCRLHPMFQLVARAMLILKLRQIASSIRLPIGATCPTCANASWFAKSLALPTSPAT